MTVERAETLFIETEQKALSLQRDIIQFAEEENVREREKKLLAIATHLVDHVDSDILDRLVSPDSSFQPILREAVGDTFDTPIKTHSADPEPEHAWKRHGSVIALASDGMVIGAYSKPTGLEGEGYGDLRRYALIKAMCRLHLAKSGKKGGILENYDYLSEEVGLPPYKLLFTGDADEPVKHEKKDVFIAASGCEAKTDFIARYLKHALLLEEMPKPGRETQAGFIDGVFSSEVVKNVGNDGVRRRYTVMPRTQMGKGN